MVAGWRCRWASAFLGLPAALRWCRPVAISFNDVDLAGRDRSAAASVHLVVGSVRQYLALLQFTRPVLLVLGCRTAQHAVVIRSHRPGENISGHGYPNKYRADRSRAVSAAGGNATSLASSGFRTFEDHDRTSTPGFVVGHGRHTGCGGAPGQPAGGH